MIIFTLFNHQENPFTIGTWNHICFTWSSTNGIVFYVNGVEVERDETKWPGKERTSGGNFVIGQVLIIKQLGFCTITYPIQYTITL